MDVAKMVEVIQEKHGVTLDPADPVFLLATVAAELNWGNEPAHTSPIRGAVCGPATEPYFPPLNSQSAPRGQKNAIDAARKESREGFARIAAELSDQVSAALVLADKTARARSERLITEAAK